MLKTALAAALFMGATSVAQSQPITNNSPIAVVTFAGRIAGDQLNIYANANGLLTCYASGNTINGNSVGFTTDFPAIKGFRKTKGAWVVPTSLFLGGSATIVMDLTKDVFTLYVSTGLHKPFKFYTRGTLTVTNP